MAADRLLAVRGHTRAGVWALVMALAVVPSPARAGQAGPTTGGGVQAPQAPPAGTSGRAPTAWFGGGAGSVGQTLTGNIGINGGTFRREPDLTLNPGAASTDSSIASVFGGLSYGLDAGRGSLNAGFSSYGNYYSSLSEDILVGFSGAVNGAYQFTNRTTANASLTSYLEPPIARSLQGIFGPGAGGGPIVPPSVEPGAIEERALGTSLGAGIRQELTSKSNLTLRYGHWQYELESAVSTQVTDDASVMYSYMIAQGLSFRAGYRYGVSRIENDPDAETTERSGIDAGLVFGRALSLTRDTTLGFGVGTSVARENDDNQFFVNGNVNLDHMMGRSWATGIYYRRNADFVEGISGIVQTDGVGAYLSGQPTRRVSVNGQGDVTRGGIGIEDRNPFSAYRAGAGMSVGISREVGLSVNYSYYRSSFASGEALLSPGLQDYRGHSVSVSTGWRYFEFGVSYSKYLYLSSTDQSLTASVSLYAPFVSRTRRPDAAR